MFGEHVVRRLASRWRLEMEIKTIMVWLLFSENCLKTREAFYLNQVLYSFL